MSRQTANSSVVQPATTLSPFLSACLAIEKPSGDVADVISQTLLLALLEGEADDIYEQWTRDYFSKGSPCMHSRKEISPFEVIQ